MNTESTVATCVVNVHDAKSRLSELLAMVERGEQVVIARAGVPVVRLELVGGGVKRRFGSMRFTVPDDFDSPLAEEELAAWE